MLAREELWHNLETYSHAIGPARTIFYLAGILVIGWLFFSPGKAQNVVAKLYIAISYAWLAILPAVIITGDIFRGRL